MEVIITIELYIAVWSRVTSHGSPRRARKSLLLSELMLPPSPSHQCTRICIRFGEKFTLYQFIAHNAKETHTKPYIQNIVSTADG